MYRLAWTNQFQRRARKFFRQHPNLTDRFNTPTPPVSACQAPIIGEGSLQKNRIGLTRSLDSLRLLEMTAWDLPDYYKICFSIFVVYLDKLPCNMGVTVLI